MPKTTVISQVFWNGIKSFAFHLKRRECIFISWIQKCINCFFLFKKKLVLFYDSKYINFDWFFSLLSGLKVTNIGKLLVDPISKQIYYTFLQSNLLCKLEKVNSRPQIK